MTNPMIERSPFGCTRDGAFSTAALGQEQAQQPPAQQPAPPATETIDEVIAIGRQKVTAFDVVEERIEQEVVTDFLGAEAIGRVGDSTVSLALRRFPGSRS